MLQPSNKTAMVLAWNFFKGNYALNFAAVAILLVLSLLGIIPIVGLLFVFAYSIVSISIQVYFARAVNSVQSEEEIADVAARTKIGELLVTYLHVAAGAFLALFTISLVFMLLFGATVSMNMDIETLQNGVAITQSEMVGMVFGASGVVGLLLLLIAAVLFYFFPSAMGEAMLSDTFTDAFKKVFLIFFPSHWKRCLNKEYFILVLVWSLILMAVWFVLLLLSASIILLPVVLLAAYIVSLYNAAIYVFALRLAK